MKEKIKNVVIGALALALCLCFVLQGNTIRDLERAQSTLQAEKAELEGEMGQAAAALDQVQGALEDEQAKRQALEAEKTELNGQLEQANRQAGQDKQAMEQQAALLEEREGELKAMSDSLGQAQRTVEDQNSELKTKDAALQAAQTEMEAAKAELETVQAELKSAQTELQSIQDGAQQLQELQGEYDELERELQREKGLANQARSELSIQKSQVSALKAQIKANEEEIERLKLNQKPEPTPTPRPVSGETVESGFIRVTPAQDVEVQADEKGIELKRDGITIRVRPLEIDAREMAGMQPWQFANYMRLEDGAFRAAVLDEGESLTIKREEEPQALSVGTGGMMCFTAQGDSGNLNCGWAMRVEDERAVAVYAFAPEGEAVEAFLSEAMEGLSFI